MQLILLAELFKFLFDVRGYSKSVWHYIGTLTLPPFDILPWKISVFKTYSLENVYDQAYHEFMSNHVIMHYTGVLLLGCTHYQVVLIIRLD